jgi:hypothetical protein
VGAFSGTDTPVCGPATSAHPLANTISHPALEFRIEKLRSSKSLGPSGFHDSLGSNEVTHRAKSISA